MQLTRYKLGDLIVQRREKNEGYDVPIRGVSREGFIKPKQQEADTSIYNVFYRNDFVFNPARMELNSIALNLEFDKALCSSLYEIFYVKDESIVLPEFLNLHIKRDEFARHCEYIGSGSAREYCRVAQISEFDIDLPPIDEQQKIVDANRLLIKRIEINKKLIATLEQTAQTLYRHTFIDNIDPNNLPSGWRMGTVGEIAKVKVGGDKPDVFSEEKSEKCKIPIYSNGLENKGIYGYTDRATIFEKCVTVSARGTIGYCCLREEPFVPIVRLLVVIPNDENMVDYLYRQLKDLNFEGSGSVQNQLTAPHIENQEILIPDSGLFKEYNEKLNPIMALINNKEQENQTLTQMQTLLLSKMGV